MNHKSNFQFLNISTSNVKTIYQFLNTRDLLQLVKVNSFFSKDKELRDTHGIYKELVNEIYQNKSFKNPSNLIVNDLKNLKILLKRHDLVYSDNKVHLLASVAGYIHGRVMKRLTDTNEEYIDSKNQQLNSIIKRMAEFIVDPDNNTTLMLNKDKNKKLSSLNNNKSSKEEGLTDNTNELSKLKENVSNLVVYLLDQEKGCINFEDKGITIHSLHAIIKSISVFNNVVRINLSKNNTENVSIKSIHYNSVSLYNKLFKDLSLSLKLKIIDVSENELTSKHVKPIFTHLASLPNLCSINLKKNLITGSELNCITSFLKTNKSVTLLDLANNLLGPLGAKYISEGLKDNETLKKLDISYNGICSEGAKYVSEVLSKTKLSSLNISGNYLKDISIDALCENLSINRILSYLFLENNDLTKKSFKKLSEVISRSESLVSLEFKNSNLNDEAAIEVFHNLSKNRTKLYSLELGENKITSIGLYKLNDLLIEHPENTIGKINIESNQLGDNCGDVLSKIINNSYSLKNLNLSNNKLGKSIIDFYLSIKSSKTLKIIDLSQNELGEYTNVLGEMLNNNTSIKNLDLSFNYINDEGVIDIAKGIEINTCLVHLNLSINRISPEGILKVTNILKNNRFKKKINYSDSIYVDSSRNRLKDSSHIAIYGTKNKNSTSPLKKKGAINNINERRPFK